MPTRPLLPDPDCLTLERIQVRERIIWFQVRAVAKTVTCPACAHASQRVHSHYRRTLQVSQSGVKWFFRQFGENEAKVPLQPEKQALSYTATDIVETCCSCFQARERSFHQKCGRAITPYRLAKDIGVDQGRISEILSGKRAISTDTALRLAAYFGTTPRLWMNLQTSYDIEGTQNKIAAELSAIARREDDKTDLVLA